MSAQLEIKLIDASPAEQQTLDRTESAWKNANPPQLNRPGQPPPEPVIPKVTLQELLSATEALKDASASISAARSITVADSSRQLMQGDSESNGIPEKVRAIGDLPPTRKAESKMAAGEADNKKSIDSFKDLRKEISDLLSRYLPDAISKPLLSMFERITGSLGRLVPAGVRDKAESVMFQSAGRALGGRPAAGVAGRAVAGAEVAAGVEVAGAGAATVAGAELGTAVAALGGPIGLAVAAIGTLALTSNKASDEVEDGFEDVEKASAGAASGMRSVSEAFDLGVKAFQYTSDKLRTAADDIEDVSAPVSVVRAQRDIQSEINRMDRANKIGPEVARNEAAWNRNADALERLETSVLAVVAKTVPILEAIVDTGTAGVEGINVLIQTVEAALAQVPGINSHLGLEPNKELAEAMQSWARFANSAQDIFQSNSGQDQLKDYFDQFINQQAMQNAGRPMGVPRRFP